MEKDVSYPEKAVITPAKAYDRRQLEIMVDDSKGNMLHLITNRFDLNAEEIPEMYKPVGPLNYSSNRSNNT